MMSSLIAFPFATRFVLALTLCGAAALAPNAAWAHASERGFVLLMPTEYYITGGVAAVVVSFLALAAAPARWLKALFDWRRIWRRPALQIGGVTVGDIAGGLGFVVFLALLLIGWFGPRDPTWNLLTLTVWTLWWVIFPFLVAAFGDLWRFIHPWRAPMQLLRRVLPVEPLARLPEVWGVWPAAFGFFAFNWFEIASLAPTDPGELADAVAAYWLGTMLAIIVFGEEAWLQRGEAFSVFFRLIGRLAPVWTEREARPFKTQVEPPMVRMVLAAPGARLIAEGEDATPYPRSTGAFILLALAALTFDGLVETFAWIAYIGLNPLEFTGRSAVVVPNTLGLIGAWILMIAMTATAISLGLRMVGHRERAVALFVRLALAMTPIALGYHFGHFLTSALVQAQHALVAVSSPFGLNASWGPQDWLGLGPYFVTTSFLYDAEKVPLIWESQAGAVALGHLVSVAMAHAAAHRALGAQGHVTLSQVPFALLMALMTLFSLWLLASPTA